MISLLMIQPIGLKVQNINDMVSLRLPHDEHVFLSIDDIVVSEAPDVPAHALYLP
jgi:hypothetical protein